MCGHGNPGELRVSARLLRTTLFVVVLCAACGGAPRGHGVRAVQGGQNASGLEPRSAGPVPDAFGPTPAMVAEFEAAVAGQRMAGIRTYLERCRPFEGDPRGWRALAPSTEDARDLDEHVLACDWRVVRQDGVLLAVVDVPTAGGDLILPFEPSFRPRWEVVRCGDEARQKLVEPPLEVRTFLEFEGGYLVGYDSGEWGGGLYWYDRSGSLRQVVSKKHVRWMFRTPSGVFVFGGLAHMGGDVGEVLRLELTGDEWSSHGLPLVSAPSALLFESESSALVAGRAGLSRVRWGERTEDLSLEHLHEPRGDWAEVTSLEKEPDGAIFLGTMHAVVRLRPEGDGYVEEWLAPEGAARSEPAREGEGGE